METLNPWIIDIENRSQSILIRIVNPNTGEFRQVDMSVDEINHLVIVGKSRIETYANAIDESTERKPVSLELLERLELEIHQQKIFENESSR